MPQPFSTHEVFNQAPAFEDVNLFTSDRALQEAVQREGGGASIKSLIAAGLQAGSAESFERGWLANRHPPELRAFDAKGRRIERVDFHPSYHVLMETSFSEALNCASWMHLGSAGGAPVAGTQVARAAGFFLAGQSEAGHCCPITMTHASVPALMLQPDVAETWLPKLLSRSYDPRCAPIEEKQSVTIGMGMTEKQGGTDVRANTTEALPEAGGGGGAHYRLTGHKWFLSAPMSDAFFMLAQAPGGLSCFLVPRYRPDGKLNGIRLQRLKDKLGNRSNATAEAELVDAHGVLIGEEGAGVAAIMRMVTYTRLDCAVASAAQMRLALALAIHHAEHRSVFERTLIDQPLMIQVLADMALDVEAATALSFRLARAFDRAQDPRAASWNRVMTPVTKYWVCKLAPGLVAEAMECLGGNGFIEDGAMPRVYREVPVNAIWEGAGNVLALDLLRVLRHEPESLEMVMEELGAAAGDDPHLKAAHLRVEKILHDPRMLDVRARALVEGLAVLAAGTIMRAHAPTSVADAFIATRMGSISRQTYGQGVDWADTTAIIERASPNR